MFTKVSNVWESSAKSPEEAKLLELKAQMMIVIRELILSNGWNQTEAAKQLKITQPRVSNLTNGQVSKFSLDTLYELLAICGYNFELSLVDGIPSVETTEAVA
ncbi:MAG: helix-turn-helix transcriptional regulator [Colwellia sp.]